jgi:aminoglycoside phosphotransferase (APT) family kinase protein
VSALDGLARWAGRPVRPLDAPGAGHSAELLFVALGDEPVVVRLASAGPPLFPDEDLARQAAVLRAAAAAGLPVPAPVVHEPDASWLGRPFLVQPLVDGRHPTDVPALAPWVQALDTAGQRALHDGFLDVLAAIHRSAVPAALAPVLRDGSDLAAEVRWWRDYAVWAFGGGPLLDLFDDLGRRIPPAPAPSLLWGDVRLGNVVVGDDLRPVAVLDWEMASIGPAEQDVAWFTALSAMTAALLGACLPGAPSRDDVLAGVEARLGRQLVDVAWHEAFAAVRAAAVHLRTAVVAGRPVPDPARDAVVGHAAALVRGTMPLR